MVGRERRVLGEQRRIGSTSEPSQPTQFRHGTDSLRRRVTLRATTARVCHLPLPLSDLSLTTKRRRTTIVEQTNDLLKVNREALELELDAIITYRQHMIGQTDLLYGLADEVDE